MERVLGLTLWVVIVLGTLAMTLLSRSGGLASQAEWFQYLAAPTGFWLVLGPLFYAAICEIIRRRASSSTALTFIRSIGVAMLVGFVLLYGWAIFHS